MTTLPLDGDSDVDAEGVGEDRGGQLAGELEQRGRAGLREPDSQFAVPFADGSGTDRPAPGWPPGESQGESVRPRTAWPRRTPTVGSRASAGAFCRFPTGAQLVRLRIWVTV
ncbi:hypothetical protein GCM10011583_44870 [Streptomyces camponoticapitis]|uniref:Uncharacterized protein n=1 Tax=Streptomyces camponoticapitis TaxID=1616125 RepID=A0ABQ2EG75_9ACTN|nr:hypothetical protein GCM10011583_44870 [Streptomyces camponoticapitis]